MPRNYSVKQTIEMLKSNIKQAKELEKELEKKLQTKSAEPKTSNPKPIKLETPKKDSLIRFDKPDKKPTKKWYQFWK